MSAKVTRRQYIENVNAMIAGLDALQASLQSSPSYQGKIELHSQYIHDQKAKSDKQTITFVLWSAAVAVGGLILFQLSPNKQA